MKEYVIIFIPQTCKLEAIQLVYSIYALNSQTLYYTAKYAEIYCLQQLKLKFLINEVCCYGVFVNCVSAYASESK